MKILKEYENSSRVKESVCPIHETKIDNLKKLTELVKIVKNGKYTWRDVRDDGINVMVKRRASERY